MVDFCQFFGAFSKMRFFVAKQIETFENILSKHSVKIS